MITQMAGTTMLAFGVVFILLLGEIDLSIAYLAVSAALIVAELQMPGSGHQLNGLIADGDRGRRLRADRRRSRGRSSPSSACRRSS